MAGIQDENVPRANGSRDLSYCLLITNIGARDRTLNAVATRLHGVFRLSKRRFSAADQYEAFGIGRSKRKSSLSGYDTTLLNSQSRQISLAELDRSLHRR